MFMDYYFRTKQIYYDQIGTLARQNLIAKYQNKNQLKKKGDIYQARISQTKEE